jgi:uncharacterized membrane protein
MTQLPPALNTVKNLLQGKGLAAHPLHVAINHAPLGLWEGGVVFDLMSTQRKWRNLGEAGYYLNLFGIFAAIPTIATGAAEFADIPTDHPAWKVTLTHAALNDVALGLAVYNWWTRRKRRNHAPDRTNLWVNGAMTAVLGLSGYLGGVIAHEYGYGTQRQGSSIAKQRESLVGPQDQIANPKIVRTEQPLPESSVDSWAGTSQAEVNDRDAAVETQFAVPGDQREMGGTGI